MTSRKEASPQAIRALMRNSIPPFRNGSLLPVSCLVSIVMSEVQTLTGRLLLAMPGMSDPRFDHAVIAMCVHDAAGALGIGIGKLHPGLRFRQLLENIGIDPGEAPDAPVHNGGPVEMQRGFILHSPEWCCQDTILVEQQYAL